MNNAIKKAIEGGYRKATGLDWLYVERYFDTHQRTALLLDPLFWQALGKAEGWNKDKTFEGDGITLISWKREWHKFIDHLAEGKPVDDFFNKILL